jgi:hypothetical protein
MQNFSSLREAAVRSDSCMIVQLGRRTKPAGCAACCRIVLTMSARARDAARGAGTL